MVMMGSQTFFSFFLKKLVKYLLVSEILYIFAALSVEIQEERTSAPWQQDAQARSMRSEFGSKCSAG